MDHKKLEIIVSELKNLPDFEKFTEEELIKLIKLSQSTATSDIETKFKRAIELFEKDRGDACDKIESLCLINDLFTNNFDQTVALIENEKHLKSKKGIDKLLRYAL